MRTRGHYLRNSERRSKKRPAQRITLLAVLIVVLGAAGFAAFALASKQQNSVPQAAAEQPAEVAQADPQVIEFANIDFAKKQLLFHQLGVLLADKAKQDAISPEVRSWGERYSIRETERAVRYADLLKSWEEPYLNITDFPETKGCHGYPTFTGMLPYEDVGKYRLSAGRDVDKVFFRLMVVHHEGAKALADIEGRLAIDEAIVSLRTATLSEYASEVDEMRRAQASLGL